LKSASSAGVQHTHGDCQKEPATGSEGLCRPAATRAQAFGRNLILCNENPPVETVSARIPQCLRNYGAPNEWRWMSVAGRLHRYRPMNEPAVAEVTARKVAQRQPEKP
jgi:hypothetical protein